MTSLTGIFGHSSRIILLAAVTCSLTHAQRNLIVTTRPETAMNANPWHQVTECGGTVSMPGAPETTVRLLKTEAGIDYLMSFTWKGTSSFLISCHQSAEWNPWNVVSRTIDTEISEFRKRGKILSERSIIVQGY